MDEVTNAKRTAMQRGQKISAPTRWLIDHGMLDGSTLHHGAGRAQADTQAIREAVGQTVSEYDPNFTAISDPGPLGYVWDSVVSNYVLNVLPPTERRQVIADIARATSGVAFIAVRSTRDKSIQGEPEQDGVRTSAGTFQKGYTASDLVSELQPAFDLVRIVYDAGGFVLAECSQPCSQI